MTVSHDRYFLESTSTQIVELNRIFADGLLRVKGNFSPLSLKKSKAYLESQSRGGSGESLRNRVRTEIEWICRYVGPKAAHDKIQGAHRLTANA